MSVHVAVRSYLTAGVAVVGASALIAAPLAVPPPEIHLPAIHASSAEVQLAALANPIAEWVTVVQTTFANVAALGIQFQNDPAPILAEILKNQLANASTLATALEGTAGVLGAQVAALPAATLLAAQQLAAGQFSAAVGTLFQAGIGLILGPAISLIGATSIITDSAQRFANVVAAIPNALLPIGLAAISPIAGAVYSFGDAGQAVIDAARAGDVAGALNALANIPAIVTNAFLNGYPPQFTTGIFSPLVEGGFGSGLIAALLDVRKTFANALSSALPPAATAASLPSSATLISLTEAPTDAAQVGDTAAKTGATTASVTTEGTTEAATDVTTAPTAAVVTEPAAVTTEPTTAEPTTATEPATAVTEPAASTPVGSAADTAKSESESTGTSTGTESTGTESSTSTSTKPSTKSSNDDKAPSATSSSTPSTSSSSTASDATKSTSASTGSTGKPAASTKKTTKDASAGSSSSGSEGSGASSAS
ncbi:hypothetical protein [Mycobacterium sp. AT1]|uniref:hypothetical protein n=1 Tax=Mycobacterium sp. AT1 TaxID=1961706 RepID=UPI0009AE50C2|nr:hypothetical protein [Mycobacterium sp. AT1]OPX06765.1 hypothetical protein B1790_26340 [Mycobacterium sp. AT1]